jgi:hypothetical protein
MPDQLPRKRRADASTTTAHERHSRYSILKHATRNIEYQRCAKRKTTQLTQKENRKRIMMIVVLETAYIELPGVSVTVGRDKR